MGDGRLILTSGMIDRFLKVHVRVDASMSRPRMPGSAMWRESGRDGVRRSRKHGVEVVLGSRPGCGQRLFASGRIWNVDGRCLGRKGHRDDGTMMVGGYRRHYQRKGYVWLSVDTIECLWSKLAWL